MTISPLTSNNPAAQTFSSSLFVTQEKAKKALDKVSTAMKKYADRKQKETPHFKIGSLVFLDTQNIWTRRPAKKLDVRRTGPFEVIAQVSPVTYKLQLPPSWTIHPVFHISLLQQAHINEELYPEIVDD